MLQIFGIKARHLEIDVGHAQLAEPFDAAKQVVFAPQGEASVDMEGGGSPARMGLLHGGVGGIGQDEEALFPLRQRLFKRGHEIGGLGALGGLAELEFNGFGPALADGVVRHALRVVVIIGLKNDLPVAAIVFVEGVEHFPQLGGVDDLAVLIAQGGVLAHRAFTDDGIDPGHGRAAEIVRPVELDEGGKDDGHGQPDRVEGADGPFQAHMVDGRLVCVEGCP